MKKIFILLFVVSLTSSCEKTVKLDLDQVPARVVIEALVTNIPGRQYVVVSRTADFYQTGKTEKVTNAVVEVEDDLGNVFNFIHNPNNVPDDEGRYLLDNFTGSIGRHYKISVTVDGVTYTSEDSMVSVMTLDKLIFVIDEDEKEDPKVEGELFQPFVSFIEPESTKDFYLMKFFRNGEVMRYYETDVVVLRDDLIEGEVKDLDVGVFFAKEDVVRMEIQSISNNAYLFYSDLSNLLETDGGLFATPPVNPRSNFSNGAMGVFQVSAINSIERVVE